MVTPTSPELSLAFGVTANPGVYALLVGSGVSRSAGILTGWEVVLDLVRKLAAAEGANPEPDPVEWYSSTFGEPPRYSTLLERLGPQAAERQSLLRGYFEATADERAEGIKTPTAAHRAIADLVAAGWIRVIVTTNFDRLLESSLEAAGVAPTVIATPDQAAGAPPLAHNRCTVIKVHGDYLDTRLKNSDDELAAYAQPADTLLDQVFDEYGLIVCGWSGEYDVALRAALERCKSRRYTTYWCVRGNASQAAEALITHRAAQVLPIDDADSFFAQLLERVTTIHESGKRHPFETHVAVETLKRYLPEERHRIRLRELVRETTKDLIAHLDVEIFPTNTDFSDEELVTRAQRLEALSERSLALTANGCYWGRREQDDVWPETVRRLAEVDVPQAGKSLWQSMFRYPALLSFYAAGIAAVAAGRYDLLASLFLTPSELTGHNAPQVIVWSIFPPDIVPEDEAHVLYPHPEAPNQKYKMPLSWYLHRALRPAFTDLVPAEREYTEAFDRFEYLASLVHQDLHDRGSTSSFGGFFAGGCFMWRTQPSGALLSEIVGMEIEKAQDQWPPLQAGLFDGSVERLLEVKGAVDEASSRVRW